MRGPEGASVQQCTGATRHHPVRLLAEVHDQVASLLGCPLPGGVQGDAEDVDTPGRVLDHGQDVGPGAVEQVGREEVARQDRLGLRAQELRPGRPAPPAGVDAAGLEDLPHGRRCDVNAQASQLTVDPPVPPIRGSRGPADRSGPLDVPPDRRSARPAARTGRPSGGGRCHDASKIVSGVTSSRRPRWRAFGITRSRTARRTRSAQFSCRRRGCRRCRTASWWRRIKISAVFHAWSRRDS